MLACPLAGSDEGERRVPRLTQAPIAADLAGVGAMLSRLSSSMLKTRRFGPRVCDAEGSGEAPSGSTGEVLRNRAGDVAGAPLHCRVIGGNIAINMGASGAEIDHPGCAAARRVVVGNYIGVRSGFRGVISPVGGGKAAARIVAVNDYVLVVQIYAGPSKKRGTANCDRLKDGFHCAYNTGALIELPELS